LEGFGEDVGMGREERERGEIEGLELEEGVG
jgi:hypothetical protein